MEPKRLDISVPASKEAQAHTLTCWAWGDEEAENTLLCVHGLTRNGRDFDFMARELANDFYVLCPDMPGRGHSSYLKAREYNYDTYVDDILHLLAMQDVEQLHWLGTSMGGILAMIMAAQKPGLLSSIIINDVGCTMPEVGLRRIFDYVGTNMEFATRQAAQDHLRLICMPFGINDEAHWQHFFTHSLEEKNGAWRLRYDPAIGKALKEADLSNIDLWPCWEEVKEVPTMLIRGESSDIFLENVAAKMADTHPALTRYTVKNTGHAPALMAEDQVKTVSNWLRKQR